MARTPGPETHGNSAYRYLRFGCRCEPCVNFYAAYQAKWRSEKSCRIPSHIDGKKLWYDYGCRCESCTAANTDYRRALRHRKRDAA